MDQLKLFSRMLQLTFYQIFVGVGEAMGVDDRSGIVYVSARTTANGR